MSDLLVLLQHGVMRRQQTVVEALDHRHRQDDQTVFMGFVCPEKGIGDIPDDGRFLLNVAPHGSQYVFRRHVVSPDRMFPLIFLYCMI